MPDGIGLKAKAVLDVLDAVFNKRVALESSVALGDKFTANVLVDVFDLIAIQELTFAQLFPCLYGLSKR